MSRQFDGGWQYLADTICAEASKDSVTLSFPVLRYLPALLFLTGVGSLALAQDSRNLAPGFMSRPAASRLVVIPGDIELFSISGGGVAEPRADWTEKAQTDFHAALVGAEGLLGRNVTRLEDKSLVALAEINALHGAVAESVFFHHIGGFIKLPTKNGVLDWSMGDAVRPLREATGADYALFTWVRDSYASAERKAMMVGMALFGVGLTGGIQVGYASLVNLNNGRIVGFNNLSRGPVTCGKRNLRAKRSRLCSSSSLPKKELARMGPPAGAAQFLPLVYRCGRNAHRPAGAGPERLDCHRAGPGQ